MSERWPGLMDKPTAAEYLCISERTITTLLAGKKIPSRTVGPKIIRFCKEELDEWMRELPKGQTAKEKAARRQNLGN